MSMNKDFDYKPLLLVPVLALAALPLIGSGSTWLTLTVAGLAMGMIIFIIASGLTLVFGLMDVLNFGHGVFIALGAFVATSVLGAMGDCGATSSPCCQPWWSPCSWPVRWAWPSNATSCGLFTGSTSSRSSSPWAA
jgi:ABC-type branched-subunit amino acid transport system permease subunit